MLYELGLMTSVAIQGWIAFDLLLARGWRRRFPSVSCAAMALLVWTCGALALRHATTPEEVLLARRMLFLGVCALGPCWLWSAGQATGARWWRHHPGLPALAALPAAFSYSALFWDRSGFFVDWYALPMQPGPGFLALWLYTWTLVLLGFLGFARFAARIVAGAPVFALLIGSGLVPLVVNGWYALEGFRGADPTPLVFGIVALLLRLAVVEVPLASYYLPFARREVVEQLGVGLMIADVDGCVVDANRAVAELSGMPEPTGHTLGEIAEATRDLPTRAIEMRTFPLEGCSGRLGTVAILEDRTEAKVAERRLEIATRLEAMGFLVSGVAHEVNNPLSYVRANLGLIRPLADKLVEAGLHRGLPPHLRRIARELPVIVDEALEGANRITRLIQRLGTFVRLEPPDIETEPADLAIATRRAIEMAALGRAADLIVISREDEVPPVRASEEDLVQIVLHLLINAIQAGGKHPPIRVEILAIEGGAAVRVKDRGPGIPEHVLGHVFDPFFTTKEAASGLGLSFSYDLARQNGGRLEAANRLEGGAVFTLWLPTAEADADDAG